MQKMAYNTCTNATRGNAYDILSSNVDRHFDLGFFCETSF